jgi:GNAT superfamily N-acetyltransferase
LVVIVRACQPADEPFLRDMLYHAIYIPPGMPPLSPDVVDQPDIAPYVRGFGRQVGDIGLLVEQDATPCGAAWVRLMQGYGFVDAHTPELTIALLPPFRGQGLGTLLLEALLDAVRPHFQQVSLSVVKENPARRLYERLGFVTVSQNGDSLTLCKRLTATRRV